ncbi:hypothetical protein JCM8097_001384 [Rhodosporidiobolus ruineniae]
MAGAAAAAYAAQFAQGGSLSSPSQSSYAGGEPSSRRQSPTRSRSRSRSSSLSSLSSSFSSSHPTTGRARSPSISGDTDDLMSDDDPLTASNNYGFDARQMETVRCEWGGACGMEFWEVEPLVEHVHQVHALPDDHLPGPPKKGSAANYICDWAGCPRRGKTQGSKFALVAHLRSHTGEKPFHCPRPECDKSFTRTDALQKHMRVQHGDNIVAARKPPGGAAGADEDGGGGTSKGKKGKGKGKKGGRAAREMSDDSAFGAAAVEDDGAGGAGGAGAGGEDDAPLAFAADELSAMALHPELSADFVAYVVAKAKYAYLIGEHEGMVNELEALRDRERELRMENEALLQGVMRKEVGSDPAERAALDQFFTSYNHQAPAYPPDWQAK